MLSIKFLPTLLLILVAFVANSQNLNDTINRNSKIKLNINWGEHRLYYGGNAYLTGITPSFVMDSKSGNQFEFGFISLTQGGSNVVDTSLNFSGPVFYYNIGIEIQHNYLFSKKSQSRLKPFFGNSYAFFITNSKFRSGTLWYHQNVIRNNYFLVPGVFWSLNEKMTLSFELSISAVSLSFFIFNYDHPNLGPRESVQHLEIFNAEYTLLTFGYAFRL